MTLFLLLVLEEGSIGCTFVSNDDFDEWLLIHAHLAVLSAMLVVCVCWFVCVHVGQQ